MDYGYHMKNKYLKEIEIYKNMIDSIACDAFCLNDGYCPEVAGNEECKKCERRKKHYDDDCTPCYLSKCREVAENYLNRK